MLNQIQKHTNLLELGIVAAGLGALQLDHVKGVHNNEQLRTTPEFYTDIKPGAQDTLIALPGCQTDAKRYFNSLSRLTTGRNLVVVDYPEHGFNVEQICEGLTKQLVDSRVERPSILCTSMGGIIMREFLNYSNESGIAEKIGGFNTITLDASPFDGHDVRRQYRMLLAAAGAAKNSRGLDAVKRLSMRTWSKDNFAASSHLDTVHSEGAFILSEHSDAPLPNIMDTVTYVASPNDPVINTDQAAEKYVKVVPYGKFNFVTDRQRPSRSHTARPDRYPYLLELGIESKNTLAVAA